MPLFALPPSFLPPPLGIPFGKLALGRVSAAPPMSCLLGILCHETFDGIHSVAKVENSRVAPVPPQPGQGGAAAEADTSSSKRSSQAVQRYS